MYIWDMIHSIQFHKVLSPDSPDSRTEPLIVPVGVIGVDI